MQPRDAATISAALRNGFSTEEGNAKVTQAIGDRIANVNKVVKEKKIEQELLSPNNYCSKPDWDTLGGPTSFDGKKRVVSERFWSLGITNPSEQTIKWAVALLVATQFMGYMKTFPSYRTIYELVLDLKAMVVSNHADARHAVHLVHYPNTPTELNTARHRIAYPT